MAKPPKIFMRIILILILLIEFSCSIDNNEIEEPKLALEVPKTSSSHEKIRLCDEKFISFDDNGWKKFDTYFTLDTVQCFLGYSYSDEIFFNIYYSVGEYLNMSLDSYVKRVQLSSRASGGPRNYNPTEIIKYNGNSYYAYSSAEVVTDTLEKQYSKTFLLVLDPTKAEGLKLHFSKRWQSDIERSEMDKIIDEVMEEFQFYKNEVLE
jgi:hypothetical protein